MMFLIRTTFWLAIVVFLIPVDDELGRAAVDGPARPIGAFEAVQVAQVTVADMGGFCDRNPDTCAVGDRIAATWMLKAQSGVRLLAGLLGADVAPRPVDLPPVPAEDRGTLTAADLEPAWAGPRGDDAI